MRIKNWTRFQHFKDRRPPWIKLYRDLLDDMEWHNLDAKSAKVLVSLWLIASESENGTIPNTKTLAFRLRMQEKEIIQIVNNLSHWLIHDDINTISERYQSDPPETETETETETYKPETEALPDWIPVEAWQGFVEMRKAKAPLTERSKALVIGKLSELRSSGQDIGKVLDQSVESGWKTVYPVKTNGGGNGRKKFDPVAYGREQLKRTLAEEAMAERMAEKVVGGGSA